MKNEVTITVAPAQAESYAGIKKPLAEKPETLGK